MGAERTVKYEEELDPTFAETVAAVPGGEHLWDCIQCGTCSATCPVSLYMDRTPRQIVGLVRAGFRDEVLGSRSIWLCTSCYACTVECPAKLPITDFMFALKRLAMEDARYRHFVIPRIEEAFVKMVRANGRLTESRMGMKVAFRNGLRPLASLVPVAWRLYRRGRLRPLHKERMRDPASLRAVLGALPGKAKGASM